MVNETGPHSAQTPVAKPERRFGARSALLPMRSGLPAALEGRKLDRQRPASGKCRLRPRRCGPVDGSITREGGSAPQPPDR
jgi:hypothetical protein